MKTHRRLFFGIFISLFLFIHLYSSVDASDQRKKSSLGVIVISHGSPQQSWNQKVLELVRSVKSPCPLEPAFIDFNEEITLEKSIKKLEGKGVDEILIVHLSPSSYSVHHEEVKYLVGLRKDLGFYTDASGPPVESTVKRFAVSPCMDDHPLVVKILIDFTMELSKDPENESLILLGHGPVEELANIMWVRQLERIGKEIRKALRFRDIFCMTLRNDSADLIREQASQNLREAAKRLSNQGRVIVLTYAVGTGMLQREVSHILQGIPSVVVHTKGVSSHSNTLKWIEDVIDKGINQPSVPLIKRSWSHYDFETGKPRGTHRYGLL